MNDDSISLIQTPAGYAVWLAELKTRIHNAQQRAALAVNRELVLLYWQIGHDILERQAAQGWGAKIIERLAHDLRTAFPQMKGFSRANLMYMRAFAQAWPDTAIVQQAVGQLPWGHNLVLLTKTEAARRTYSLDEEWLVFVTAKKAEELARIIADEGLNAEETKKFVDNAFRDGAIPSTGTAITKILPPVSRFSRNSNHSAKKQTVLDKLATFFERYFWLA